MGRTMDCYKKLGSGLPGNTDQLENGMWTFISSSLAEHWQIWAHFEGKNWIFENFLPIFLKIFL